MVDAPPTSSQDTGDDCSGGDGEAGEVRKKCTLEKKPFVSMYM